MPALPLHPEIEQALEIGNRPMPADPREAFNAVDRPFLFGDDVIDNLQGLLHIAKNANRILRAPSLPRCDQAPAIAIGGGPSLDMHWDALRRLQHKCLIVCSQTTVKAALANGVTPHLTTPMERPRYMQKYLPETCHPVAFAGAPLVHPSVLAKFQDVYYVPSADALYKWCEVPGEGQLFYGSSTGTTAVNVAAFCTRQKVYLVGHDLSYANGHSHCGNSQAILYEQSKTSEEIEGHNGEMLPTEYFWKRLCSQISDTTLLHQGLVNVNGHYRIGAKIPGLLAEPLPDPDSLPDFTMPTSQPNPARLREWRKWARKLPMHARQLDRFFQAATAPTPEQTDIMNAGLGKNAHAFAYLLVSVLVQLSYESRSGMVTTAQLLDWMKTATHNALYANRGFFDQIAECAERVEV